jgi:two-component system chemotaxis response regulator CheY
MLKTLIAEDDFTSRLFLQTFLSRYCECHIAVNGSEAVEVFRTAAESGSPFDLICMDILMPGMDGHEAVKQVRALEAARGILPAAGVKIIMVTTLNDMKEVVRSFQGLCDAYLVKPIDGPTLLRQMWSLGLME